MRAWVADGEKGLMLREGTGWRVAGPPGRTLCPGPGGVFCAGDRLVTCYDGATGRAVFDFSSESGICAMACDGEALYLLSADADCITARSASSGQMLFSAPAGVYPRDLSLRNGLLAAACGAAGEIVFFDRQLRFQGRVRVPGIACGVCFLPQGAAALCAVGDEELSSLLLRISPRGVTEEVFSCAACPCCVAPAGNFCAVGCSGAVYFLRPGGGVARALPCVCPTALRAAGGKTLVCDPCMGRVLLPGSGCLYAGSSPEDALILP